MHKNVSLSKEPTRTLLFYKIDPPIIIGITLEIPALLVKRPIRENMDHLRNSGSYKDIDHRGHNMVDHLGKSASREKN